jgi:NADPH:quinone reductase-like Zn-dependent oxidoreductase
MKAYELRGKGLESLARVDREVPRPGRGQVLVRMRSASLNYRDLLIAQGRYGRGPIRYPLVPLSDGAGEVEEVGAGVTRLAPKDRVVGSFFQSWIEGPFDSDKASSALGGAIDGVLAQYVVLEEAALLKIPEHLSFEEGATLPCAALTAWVVLMELGRLQSGQSVLVMGTGGVSLFGLQFAKLAGAFVIVTSSSDAKLARAKALGADAGINYNARADWDERAREITRGRGVDHLLEVGGKETLPLSQRALRVGGHLSLIGLLSGEPADKDLAQKNGRELQVDAVYVGSVQQFERMNDAVTRSKLHPVIDRVFPFEDADKAYRHLESGSHFGKVVIAI